LPGRTTLKAVVTGQGFSTVTASCDATVSCAATVLGSTLLRNINAEAHYHDKKLAAAVIMRDSLLAFDLKGNMGFDTLQGEGRFILYGADLRGLALSRQDLWISATAEMKLISDKDNFVCGHADFRNIHIYQEERHHFIDSVILISRRDTATNLIAIQSEILQASIKGKFTPSGILPQIRNIWSVHSGFPYRGNKDSLQRQQLQFSLALNDPSLLISGIIPGLTSITPFELQGGLNSTDHSAELRGYVGQIIYRSIVLDSFNVRLNATSEKFQSDVRIAELSNPFFKAENLKFSSSMRDGIADLTLSLKEDNDKKLFDGGAFLTSSSTGWKLRLKPEVVINDQKWTIDPENYFTEKYGGLAVNNFNLTRESESLLVKGTLKDPNEPLSIRFVNFNTGNLSRVIENEKQLFDGLINGMFSLRNVNGSTVGQGKILISNAVLRQVSLGDISIEAGNSRQANAYDFKIKLSGSGNDLGISGFFNSSDKSYNIKADINALNLQAVEPFTFGELSRVKGRLSGGLNIQVNDGFQRISGKIAFAEAGFKSRYLDSYFNIPQSSLSFDNGKLMLRDFVILDSLDHEARIDGSVNFARLNDIPLDLHIKSSNFLALNTTKKDNRLYYGTIFIDSDIRATGTVARPRLDVKGTVNKGSSFTYVKRQNTAGKNEGKGIVEFYDTLSRPSSILVRRNDTVTTGSFKGMDLHARINLNRQVQIKIIVDPLSGDSLYVSGDGALDLTYDTDGNSALTGRYRIYDGGYFLSINNVIKRSFKIRRGSIITWSGDMLDPFVDLSAIYRIKASPLDLVQNEVTSMTQMERNKYRKLLNFDVYLKMNGFISAPEISFDIQLAPEDRGALNGVVNAKIAQLSADESQLNKQVFALLTLKRFVADNPLESSNDGGVTSASRSSASQLLTQQLGALSGRYVNFVDLDLGVNSFEDYSSGREEGRTQLQVGVSKQLLDDRVTIRVGGNVELEGQRSKQNNANDVAGNISIDYKLTEDGRYKARAFRENQYENPIEGELTKTGAGVILTRNFNRFKELFSKPKKRRKTTDER
jgi:translocation and assembly module TamB